MPLVNSISSFVEALPVPGRALSLRTPFNLSLINSLKYLLSVCDEVIPPDLFSKATQKLDSLNPESKLSGLLGIVHTDLFNAADRQDVQRVNYIIPRLAADNFQVENLTYINVSNLNDYYSPLLKNIFAYDLKREYTYSPLSSHDFDKARSSLQRGLRVLERAFPDFYTEFQELVGEIIIINSEGLQQGSSPVLFGMIYKSCLWRCEKITDALDCFIHEQSHLYVHALNKDDPILLNPLEKGYSPLRKEERPLIGLYHATFVLARVQYVLEKALALNEIPNEEKEYCRELITLYKKCIDEGLETLKVHAKMTPLGEGLLSSSGKLAA